MKEHYRPQEDKRRDFDTIIKLEKEKISSLSVAGINQYRIFLRSELKKYDDELKKREALTPAKIKYFKGKRMVCTRLLSYSKERLKIIHVVTHNGSSRDFSVRFIQAASEVLPINLFQKIYGIASTKQDMEEQSIHQVRDFIEQSCEIAEGMNGNTAEYKHDEKLRRHNANY